MRRIVLITAVLLLATIPFTTASHAQSALTSSPAATADAYGLMVRSTLLTAVPLSVGPIARATQDYLPGAATPATASVAQVGPQPANGSVVKNVGVIQSSAEATKVPKATAIAQAANVELFADAAGVPAVSADLLRSQANADCLKPPDSAGTQFVNLKVGGTPIGGNPPPNTRIPLGLLTVIINEQHPLSDGRGFEVNAIHVVSTATGAPLFTGDVIVSHAMASVACPNGALSTGATNPIQLTKDVTPTTVNPGDTVTYTASITNKSPTACVVNAFVDHAPQALEFVSTSGALGKEATASPRPGGGSDVLIVPAETVTIDAGKAVSQTFVFKVLADAKPGVYYNNLEVFCADQGNFSKGLDAPFEIPAAAPPAVEPTGELPATGGGLATPLSMALLGASAMALGLRRRAAVVRIRS